MFGPVALAALAEHYTKTGALAWGCIPLPPWWKGWQLLLWGFLLTVGSLPSVYAVWQEVL